MDLLFTYAIVFAPGREIVEKSILMYSERLNKNSFIRESTRNLIRTLMVGVTVGMSQVQQVSCHKIHLVISDDYYLSLVSLLIWLVASLCQL